MGPPSGGGRRILFTTSRAPSPRTRSLVKDLAQSIPGGLRITRGHLTMVELAALARVRGADRVTIVGERRGNPSILRIYSVTTPPEPPRLVNIVTLLVKGVSLSRERGATPPKSVNALYVEAREGAEDYADAVVLAWHGRLLVGPKVPRDSVIVIVEPEREGAIMDFRDSRGRPNGPRLRVASPRRMVKGGGALQG